MKYDFDEIVDRRDTDSVKWDSAPEGVLPMWVADMDFKTAPCVIDALRRRVDHGVFGYVKVPDSYYESIRGWFKRRHAWEIDPEWVIYTSGVIPALSAIVKALTKCSATGSQGCGKVLIQTPVYNHFFTSIRNNGCEIVENPLKQKGDSWEMDYEDLEAKASDPQVRMMILCNPHNPCGRVWSRKELERVGEICGRHGVTVVSDEIHCELVMPGYKYTPYASISKEFEAHCVTCISPSKAFNIAGLQIANIVCANPEMRARIDRAINDNEVCDVNPFGVVGLQAAYNEGGEWLDALIEYLNGNYQFMRQYCLDHLPELPLTRLEGTYLVWMDCRKLGLRSAELEELLVRDAKLFLNSGDIYGADGEGWMRWNIACPRRVLEDGLQRFAKFVRKL